MAKDKTIEYTIKIQAKIAELFDEDNESDYHIDQQELMKGDNLTDFMHALANMAPCNLYNKITGSNENQLTFNHIANQLCFQYSKKSDK